MTLKRIWVWEIKVIPLEKPFNQDKEKEYPEDIDIDFFVAKHDNHNEFVITLNITYKPPRNKEIMIDFISIKVSAEISFPDTLEEEELRSYVPSLCLANLYGSARGIIAQATGLFPQGPYFLPVVNIIELLKKKQKKLLKEEKNN
ncbi:MAG: hypothetical protein HN590_14365 [Calditrichaeota bacterium]|jgi:hypothetical protein|nr:hypothetical protein [Calditrichota bacterium]